MDAIRINCQTLIRLTTAAAPLVLLPCTSATARTVMTEIVDAGIYCDTSSPAISTFYDAVRKRCVGKVKCTISATMVTSRNDLVQHKCTGFFAAPLCQGVPKNIETRNVFGKLSVSCDR